MSVKEWQQKDKTALREWLTGLLHDGEVEVTFLKRDGTERVMKCTLVAEVVVPYEAKTERKKEKSLDVLSVWDIEAGAWRSFKLDCVKEIKCKIGQ